jgi:hypothetical protein
MERRRSALLRPAETRLVRGGSTRAGSSSFLPMLRIAKKKAFPDSRLRLPSLSDDIGSHMKCDGLGLLLCPSRIPFSSRFARKLSSLYVPTFSLLSARKRLSSRWLVTAACRSPLLSNRCIWQLRRGFASARANFLLVALPWNANSIQSSVRRASPRAAKAAPEDKARSACFYFFSYQHRTSGSVK